MIFWRKNHQSGFSAIELVMTMTLLSIFGIGMVSTMDLAPSSTQAAMLKVAEDIRYAQNRAMTTGTAHGFKTTSTTSYEIYQGSPGNPTTDPTTRTAMTVNFNNLFKGVSFQGSYQIQFDGMGKPTVGGGSSVVLQKGTSTRTFTVVANTGFINLP